MEQPNEPPRVLTPAERHYESVKRASRAYWRRLHPNPRPVGRPRKVVPAPEPEPLKMDEPRSTI